MIHSCAKQVQDAARHLHSPNPCSHTGTEAKDSTRSRAVENQSTQHQLGDGVE